MKATDTESLLYLDTPEQVELFLDDISGVREIALDTEGASFHRFIDRIYLLQITTRERSAVIDPIPGRHSIGYHGYLSTEPKMNALFVAVGPDIKQGHTIGLVDNVDVAPTIAKLLGVTLPNTDGKPLTQILADH